MLRTTSVANSFLGILTPQPNSICVQCVRWRRKPRWLPVAKSKMFRIPDRPQIPEDEKLELRRLNNNYNTLVRSMRRHIMESMGGVKLQVDIDVQDKSEEEDFVRSFELNERWNESVAKSREARLAKERVARKEHILKKLLEKEEKELENIKKIEERVRRVKEESITFITAANIDQAIEDAIANPVDYNWAIDASGTIYRGKYGESNAEDNERQKEAQHNI